jgi:hypothetical protein
MLLFTRQSLATAENSFGPYHAPQLLLLLVQAFSIRRARRSVHLLCERSAEAYFDSARYVIEGVLKRQLSPSVHGVAGVFLFRHYLEISLKFIIMHARWLPDHGRIARPEEVEDVAKTHRLKTLWQMAVKDCKGKIREETWNEWDIEFVEKMILEFDAVDSNGFRFRYHGETFGSHDPIRDILRVNDVATIKASAADRSPRLLQR